MLPYELSTAYLKRPGHPPAALGTARGQQGLSLENKPNKDAFSWAFGFRAQRRGEAFP